MFFVGFKIYYSRVVSASGRENNIHMTGGSLDDVAAILVDMSTVLLPWAGA